MPALEYRQGQFMPRNYYDEQYYGRRDSRPPMDNVDAYLRPRLPIRRGDDHWRPLGTGGNNGAPEGRPF